ncbi:PWI domain-containing protein [Cyphellophora attinorum]|uniref:PWI domain-containing protein n=1 Tax=Cyphellophora attinorum TaxID=1664694 RepID=A0A0N1HW52_9EURO|nr:PWI domain-containing protein [Phialophora attinorum]KPI41732.1 PWI domain-containing protein [Phialophora attinorum]
MAASVDQKLRAQTKFPAEFNQKVDMQKVNVEVMKKWIAGKITEILGNEDDIVIELCFNLLEGTRFPDIKDLQISLTGFLDKDAAKFCKELWNLCLSAQSNPQGVPKELLEAKKLELLQEKVQAEKAVHDSAARRDLEQSREAHMNDLRQQERAARGGDRGSGRGRGRGRGGLGGREGHLTAMTRRFVETRTRTFREGVVVAEMETETTDEMAIGDADLTLILQSVAKSERLKNARKRRGRTIPKGEWRRRRDDEKGHRGRPGQNSLKVTQKKTKSLIFGISIQKSKPQSI